MSAVRLSRSRLMRFAPLGADTGILFLAGIRPAWIQGARFTLPFSSGTMET